MVFVTLLIPEKKQMQYASTRRMRATFLTQHAMKFARGN
jgi:hypothetical protein